MGLLSLLQTRPAGGGAAFACGDLAACGIGDLGTKDHHLLDGLADDDHTIYGLLSGRSGGQAFKGGAGSGEHLTLQSTAHASRGYVRAQDDLQLLSNILRDAGGNNRLQLATSSPHLLLTGNPRLDGWASIGCAPVVNDYLAISPSPTWTAGPIYMIHAQPSGIINANTNLYAMALLGTPTVAVGRTAALITAIAGVMVPSVGGAITELTGVESQLSWFGGAGSLGTARGLWANAFTMGWVSGQPSTVVGLDVADVGHASIAAGYGVRIANLTAITSRLLEVGPATPYARIEGGSAPTGVNSKAVVNFGGTLYRLTRHAAGYVMATVVA